MVLVQDTAPYIRYSIQNIDFTASPGTSLERHITGNGTYIRFEEFAILQDMDLCVQVKDPYTNQAAYFTNDTRLVARPFPLIQANLTQTNGTLLQTFSIQLFAAPVREIWFSTALPFTATNRFSPTNKLGGGDLLSMAGRVVKRNTDLTGLLGVMPPTPPDLGLDALDITGKGEILFSLPVNVFSEKLGFIQHGDLLSNRGAIVKQNQDLLSAFKPASSFDAGLDAVQLMTNGEIFFSIQSNVVVNATLTLSRGDILSDRGQVVLSHQQLLARFHPANTNYDYGLGSFCILPSGEIWFSVEEGFDDQQLGKVQRGDLLSNLGYRVFSNQELLAAFSPADPALDYGLDALFVVTDMQPPRPPPQIVQQQVSGDVFHFEWDGTGAVFQIETTPALSNPWVPCTPILPDLSSDAPIIPGQNSGFYRLRQW